MSAPHDRPAHGEPGGCECFTCGAIFIGAPWHSECAVCVAQGTSASGRDPQGREAKPAGPVANGDAPNPHRHTTTPADTTS